MNLHTQWMTTMLMMTSGLALGLLFDSYRVAASQFKFSRWMLSLFDLLYWLGATLFIFQMLVKGNQGQLRLYVLLGLFIGTWLYTIFLSKITIIMVRGVIVALKAVWFFFVRCIHVLILLPFKGLWTGIKALTLLLTSFAMFLLKIVIQCLYPLWLLIFRLFKPLFMPLWSRFAMTKRCEGVWQGVTSASERITAWIIGIVCVIMRFLDLFRRNR